MIHAIPTIQTRLSAYQGVLVDSNVLLDIATSDPNWREWSETAMAECAEHATLIINPIIYAEVSIGYSTIEALDASADSRRPWPYSTRNSLYLLYAQPYISVDERFGNWNIQNGYDPNSTDQAMIEHEATAELAA